MKKLKFAVLPLSLLFITGLTHAATSDGKTIGISAGWMHIMPQGKKQGVNGNVKDPSLVGLIGTLSDPDAGFEIKDADTGAILLDYYVNDNVSIELVGGVPPKMKIEGKGSILKSNKPLGLDATIDLESLGTVGDVDAYTPALLAKYQFGSIDSKFRPFFGAGVMYAHFSDFKLGGNVNQALTNANDLTKLLQPSVTKVDIDDAFAPVVTLGADYNITKDWFATASVTYAHLNTNATLDLNSNLLEGDLLQGKSKIEINPIVTYVGIGYRF